MIQFFRINDPYRLLFVLLLLVLARLPYYWLSSELMFDELNWLIVGEKLQKSGTLYSDVWIDLGPLSAGVYYILFGLFGKTPIPFYVVSVLLVIYQALIFNLFLNDDEAYNEKTYLPALFYALLMCWDVSFLTLPPILMAMPFLLLVLRNTIRSDDPKDQNKEYFKTGLYLGIASLFYFPAILYVPLTAFLFLLFRSFQLRNFLTFLFGMGMALIWPVLYFSYTGSVWEVIRQYFNFQISIPTFIEIENGLWLLVFPSIWLFIAFFRLLAERGFVNFQVNVQRIFIVWLFGGVLAFFWIKDNAMFHLIAFIPVFAFFIVHYFLVVRRKKLLNILFLFWLLGTIGLGYNNYWGWLPLIDRVDHRYARIPEKSSFPFQGETIWAISPENHFYQFNQLATPYLDHELSQKHLGALNDDLMVIALAKNLSKRKPRIIYDPNRQFAAMQAKIHWFEAEYARMPGTAYYFLQSQ